MVYEAIAARQSREGSAKFSGFVPKRNLCHYVWRLRSVIRVPFSLYRLSPRKQTNGTLMRADFARQPVTMTSRRIGAPLLHLLVTLRPASLQKVDIGSAKTCWRLSNGSALLLRQAAPAFQSRG